ncbi:nhaA2 [Symbiodinium microadriaticum]|nr:nhaA2 [Symbiodinium microadriaticum]
MALASTISFAEETTADRETVEGWVKDYLMENPEIVRDAIMELQRRETAAKEAAVKTALSSNQKMLLHDPDSFVAGNPNGDITVVEFFDYKCGYCKRALPALVDLINSDPNIRVVLKEFPILGPQSVIGARAAIAAMNQAKGDDYMKFHQQLMMSRGDLTEGRVMEMAGRLGLDPAKLAKDMRAREVDAVISRNHQLARMLDITGTPAFVIGNRIVPGAISLSEMKQIIAEQRARQKSGG